MKRFAIIILFLHAVFTYPQIIDGDDDSNWRRQADFFENRIRPLLVTHCLECHGSETAENGLRLDSRASILAGGDSDRAAAVAGQPEISLIVQAVRYESDLRMPPDAQLDKRQIEDLAAWVKMGMPWPENSRPTSTTATMTEKIREHRSSHWSYQPVRRPEIPGVRNREQIQSSVDQILLAKLESVGLKFSEPLDRRTLIRRATFDLLGLPPTIDQLDNFVNDTGPNAYAKLIDRLLESPHYGERWARHWLDVARYADTRGYTFDNADRNYPFAYTYRDYVIDAFNNDLPYDQFIREQLAADYLEIPSDKKTLAALGFITVGRKYISRPDTVDDQVDVVTRGLMGLTVSCARCHDHKYDAIPTEDYYSLYGIFDNCHEPTELPLIGETPKQGEAREFLDELARLQRSVAQFADDYHQRLQDQMNDHLTDYLVRAIAPNDEKRAAKLPEVRLKKSELNVHAITDWQQYLAARAHYKDPVTIPLKAMFELPDDDFEKNSNELVQYWKTHKDSHAANPIVMQAFFAKPPSTKAELGVIYAGLLNGVQKRWVKLGSQQPALDQFEGAERELAELVFADDSPAQIPRSRIDEYFNIAESKQWGQLKSKVAQHHAASPASITRAMTIREDRPPHNPRVMLRGDHTQLGAEVPRQFLEILTSGKRKPFSQRAGRLELAGAIASRKNPLTARVLVNRVWMHHFSKPLVDTPSDFGIRCEQPVQHDLLDYLACELMDHGWSIKHLHRTIMMTRAYCQASVDCSKSQKIDPENRLIWKMNRRRLEFEAIRDSMLAVAGNLDRSLHGPAVDLFREPWPARRTLYGKIDRQDLPNLLRIFDIASPDQSAAKRTRTTVPQQSLFMMNNRFTIQQSRLLAARFPLDDDQSETADGRIQDLYLAVLQRKPTAIETKIGKQFLLAAEAQSDKLQLTAWQRYAQTLMCTNEFEFID